METQNLPIETQVTLGLAAVVGTADYGELIQVTALFAQQADTLVVESKEQLDIAVDGKTQIVKAYKRVEELRVLHVGYPTKLVTEINKACKSLKDSLDGSKRKVARKAQNFLDLEEKKREAANIELQAKERAAAGEECCATCLSIIHREGFDSIGDCHMREEGKITVIGNIQDFKCEQWHHQIDLTPQALPIEGNGEPIALESSTPKPPPPPDNVVTTESGATAHTRKQWTFEVTNFEKFVRAVGSTKKTELVAADLLEIKTGAVNKLLRRDEDPIRKIPGLKIREKKVLV